MASEIRNRFTDTEMQIARETDLPELLSHLGYQVKRVGRFHKVLLDPDTVSDEGVHGQ